MHSNFRDAAIAIVHDLYLSQIPWTTDGTPCIALALSPWFSRGWTALELIVSRNMKVIFQHPQNLSEFVLKDLNKVILAYCPLYCDRGHWIASRVIGSLRGKTQRVDDLQKLLHIIKTRATSWPRDRLIIAALLCGLTPDVQSTNMLAVTTEQDLKTLSPIPASFLFHGCPADAETGLFSWCPSSLLEVGKVSHISRLRNSIPNALGQFDTQDLLDFGSDGTIIARFLTRILDEDDKYNFHPISTHQWQDCKVRSALQKWKNCLVLWPYEFSHLEEPELYDMAILATVIRTELDSENCLILDCRFEGAVSGVRGPEDVNSKQVRLGKTSEEPLEPASKIVSFYQSWRPLESSLV